ncbi:hypothetical protein AYK26_07640 [Euryarchaeota archaeon SM23-78]|nr:MAG: hypothetical protein AYK26_07640 [Euryarchaeota archaeon SM23-78]
MKKLSVVLSGLIYPVTMMHYFWRAFERRKDIDLFVTGPFFDTWIPWANGMNLPHKYVKRPNLPLPKDTAKMSVDTMIIHDSIPKKIDLWIECDAGWRFSNRPPGTIVAQIQTDPHVLKRDYRKVMDRYDYRFCMQTPYIEDDEYYLPYAYDPELHYPMDLEKEYDVCLIGLQYPKRIRVLNRLKSKYVVRDGIGTIYDEYREEYNKSRVSFSWSSKRDLPARVWESFAMGIPLVTNYVDDLSTNLFFHPTHYLHYKTEDEAVEKIEWLLANEDEALEMAHHALKQVEPHTWDARVEKILKTCELINTQTKRLYG